MTLNTEIAALVPKLKGARVAVVGDLMLDRFVYGTAERISPEAPIPVVRIAREESMLGGAGNVVRNIVGLGGAVEFISVVGQDPVGREVMGLVGELDGVEPHLLVERGRTTTIKTRYIAGHQQMLRADRETSEPIGDSIAEDAARLVCQAMADCTVVAISDYAKGMLIPREIATIIHAAKAAGRTVIVDPKGSDYSRYKGANILTPNARELAAASGMPVSDDRSVELAARKILKLADAEAVVVTRGADGMSVVRARGKSLHLPALADDVIDVSGAGDTVVATLATAMAGGIDLDSAARLATVAASIVVAKVGTAVAYSGDLVRALRHDDLATGEDKVVTLEQAVDEVGRWRRQGLKIGFTNGCFDLLHPGHVSLIGQARAACDRLVVGLNSDASVKRLKGADRPVQGEAARASVLGSLGNVDLVVIFAEDTPMETIRALKPEVLVKGADYTKDKVVGAREVESWGGRVVLAKLVAGQSTSSLIAKSAR
ncbi:MAG: D-glycero-beta-D-manno-heptose 1-phosphate adenylyltransferase [Alphaproteobacteria bacterium]|nr:D-glycero-beta-D-manno-heptose 1-phosphate adenylyltransferase [Alphaproteobacteria bacterium]